MNTKIFIAIPECTPTVTIELMRHEAITQGFCPIFAIDVLPLEATTIHEFNALCKAIHDCPIFIANLTPEDHIDPHANTNFMLGFAEGLGKLIFSFTNCDQLFKDRVLQWNHQPFQEEAGMLFDKDDMMVENMGGRFNLMLEGPSRMTGSTLFTPQSIGITLNKTALYTDIRVFKQTLLEAKTWVEQQRPRQHHYPIQHEYDNLVYLAGPDVFIKPYIEHFERKKEILLNYGLKGLPPTEAMPDINEMLSWACQETGDNPHMRFELFKCCYLSIQKSAFLNAQLTTFRGDLDSGTIVEIGLAYAKAWLHQKKPTIFAYSNSPRSQTSRYVYSRMVDGAILSSGGLLTHYAIDIPDFYCDNIFSIINHFEQSACFMVDFVE